MSRHINAVYEEIGKARKREHVKKPYENEKVIKLHNGKGCKTISIKSSSSISISLRSDNLINAQVSDKFT